MKRAKASGAGAAQGAAPVSTAVAAVAVLVSAVLLLTAAAAGCARRPSGPGPAGLGADPGQVARALQWNLASDPGSAGTYRLTFTNPGTTPVGTQGLVAFVRAEVGEPSGYPRSVEVSLPADVAPGGSASVSLDLPTQADWPDSFTVVALVGLPTGGTGNQGGTGQTGNAPATGTAPVEVARAVLTPGAIAAAAVWPDPDCVDFPPDGYLLLKFTPAVSRDSLEAALSIQPTVPFSLKPDTNGDPGTFEIHPASPLAPYTLYTVQLAADLLSADGKTRMGRPRAFRFSTGPAAPGLFSPPAWSADGSRVAWTAPGPKGGVSLYVGEVATMKARPVVTGVQGGTPSWGAGNRDLYYVGLDSGRPAVCRFDAATGASLVLVRAADIGNPGRVEVLARPAGRYLAIEADYGAVDAHSDLMKAVYLYDLDARSLTRLPEHGLNTSVVGWSGSALLYAGTYRNYDNSHHFRYDLFAYDPAAGTERALLGGGELDNAAGYSVAAAAPVGAYWTFQALSLGVTIVHRPSTVWMMWGLDQTDVPAPVQATPDDLSYRDVALSPDGTLAAAAKAVGGSWDLVVFDTGEFIERSLASGPAAQFAPAWSPDGTRIAYVTAEGNGWSVIVDNPATDVSAAFTINP